MPKISYLAKAKNGTDDTEVTALQIEQKIADIEALLRGMIDEDNMLCDNDGTKVVPLSPSNVVDMPVETRPVQQCMKFFSTFSSAGNAVMAFFDDVVLEAQKANKLASVNGIGDTELIIDAVEEKIQFSSKSFEIPNFYTPLRWDDLWQIISDTNANIKSRLESGQFIVDDELLSVDEFAEEFGIGKDNFVVETSYTLNKASKFNYSGTDINLEKNIVSFSLSLVPDVTDGDCVFRIVPSILCRVNP